MKGRFVSIEGPDGGGKSTQAKRLVAALTESGKQVLYTREPGGTPTGDLIRDILQHDASGEAIHPETELLLFAASRAQLVQCVIKPALARGEWVICDRFIDSTTAYQGYGRGFPVNVVESINTFATQGLLPDLTLLLNVDVALGAQRTHRRNADIGQIEDRFEREDDAYLKRVRDCYLALAEASPERFRLIDASRDEDSVFETVWALISELEGSVE